MGSCRKIFAQTSTPSPTPKPRETTPEFVESPNICLESPNICLESPDEGPEVEIDPAVVTLCGEKIQLEPSESVALMNMCLETFGQ